MVNVIYVEIPIYHVYEISVRCILEDGWKEQKIPFTEVRGNEKIEDVVAEALHAALWTYKDPTKNTWLYVFTTKWQGSFAVQLLDFPLEVTTAQTDPEWLRRSLLKVLLITEEARRSKGSL